MAASTSSKAAQESTTTSDSSTHPAEQEFSAQVAPTLTDTTTRPTRAKRGVKFWLIILSILISLFLSALDFTAISTALPTITHDLNGNDFVWVGSAYALASTALLPATGGLAQIFGRRPTMLLSQALFALGSALCGSAKNMNWLIAARTIQGAGGGGLQAITQIVVSDLVPLRERPLFNALIGVTWGIAAAIGPIVSGSLAQQGQWRWLFYLNLPLTGLAAVLVFAFLNLKTPEGSFRDKFMRMDWIGNFLIISSSSAVVIALTWGGVKFPWSSASILAPLILGLVGFVAFFLYEATLAKNPLIPFTLVSNRTSLSGYIQNFVGPCTIVGALYFLPVYYQACKNASPTRSGVELFGLTIPIGPILILGNASIAVTKRYRVQIWFAWALTVAGMGALSTLKADSTLVQAIGYPILVGVGSGIWYGATYFPVLAPLPVEEVAHALAFFAFGRQFAGVWGVTIGTAVLQTQLTTRLPADFIATLPGGDGVALAYSLVPVIPTLEPPLRGQVQAAYADSIAVIWQVLIGVAGIGLLASLFMKGLPLHTETDKNWGMKDEGEAEKEDGPEKQVDVSVEVQSA
ncbi:hypothetical protein PHLGIDRAFT_129482 [Phlebiopsis gigantea 11061_1 CR5-6]|uniref:Major facilitator superfamily (MFS) profile domain-containing protein n=1 Tax=Phlebiopsis gigantea (strain 11061_1 CR5-6) TaxID=745531 RepID=A0A0C3S3K5_PHLG1|nr:hypothetical protein PHLGIDRAFT_129482 [Phlebiopsis gigantea 11061_1 CR5-6]